MTKIFKKAGSEKGNALFLILIAVALFAALSYAVTQSGRGSGTIDRENAAIAASQVTQYAAALRTTVTRMVLTGTAANAVDFTTASPTGSAQVFASAGGGAVNQAPPTSAGTATAWHYLASTATNGFFVTGIGATTGQEILAYLPNMNLSACTQVNRGLGFTTTAPAVQATPVVYPAAAKEGIPSTQDAGGTSESTANATFSTPGGAQPFACFNNGTSGTPNYTYYHTLAEQ